MRSYAARAIMVRDLGAHCPHWMTRVVIWSDGDQVSIDCGVATMDRALIVLLSGLERVLEQQGRCLRVSIDEQVVHATI